MANTAIHVPYNEGSKELEMKVLGCMMSDDHSLKKVFEILKQDSFVFYPQIANIIFELYESKKGCDLLTVFEASNRKLNPGELAEMTTMASLPNEITRHCRILYQYYLTRKLIDICQTTIQKAINGGDSLNLLDDLKERIKIDIPGGQTNSIAIKDIKATESIIDAKINGYKCFKFDFKINDKYKLELDYAAMCIIAARPSVGKTAFMLNIVFQLLRQNVPVMIFSFESSIRKLKSRMLSAVTGISGTRLKRGLISDSELDLVKEASNKLDQLPLYFNGQDRDIYSITTAIRNAHKKGTEIFFLDNMSNVRLGEESRMDLKIEKYITELAQLKEELNITIVLIVHLSRDNSKEKMSQLRNSGAYEQTADMIIFLSNVEETNQIEVDCTKNRDDALFCFNLEFDKETQTMKNTDAFPFDAILPQLEHRKEAEKELEF